LARVSISLGIVRRHLRSKAKRRAKTRENHPMRFMMMHKMTDEMEKGLPPTPAVMEGVGKLIEDAVKAKVFVSGEGLKPSSQRVHLVYKNGKRTITNGPFTNPRELVAGFALLRVRSQEEATSWLDRFAALLGDVEIFMGPVVEPWDFGAAKPADAPLRFLSMHQMDSHAENEEPPDPKLMAKMGTLVDEMTKAGVLEATGGLTSTKKGTRIHFENGTRAVHVASRLDVQINSTHWRACWPSPLESS
jgi:hypothetical protein